MAKDFKVDQIRTDRLIVTGSTLLIYSSSVASDNNGEIDTAKFDKSGIGADTFIFVSGSVGSRGSTIRGVTGFGGDIVVSGSLTAAKISGSLTRLSDGTSYIVASGSVVVISQSNGAVAIYTPTLPTPVLDGQASFRHESSGSGYSSWHLTHIATAGNLGATFTPTAGALYAIPLIPPGSGTRVVGLGTRIQTASPGTMSLGIYTNAGYNNNYPTTLVGQTSIDTTVGSVIRSGSLSATISGGSLYWIVIQTSATPTMLHTPLTITSTFMGWGSYGFEVSAYTHFLAPWIWDLGVLPSTFPPTASLIATYPPAIMALFQA